MTRHKHQNTFPTLAAVCAPSHTSDTFSHTSLPNQKQNAEQIVAVGVDVYVKMLLSDHFIHTDLHPGNILVEEVPNQGDEGEGDDAEGAGEEGEEGDGGGGGGAFAAAAARAQRRRLEEAERRRRGDALRAALEAQRHAWAAAGGNGASGGAADSAPAKPPSVEQAAAPEPALPASTVGDSSGAVAAAAATTACAPARRTRPRLVLLDFGLAEELPPAVRSRFVSFLNQIAAGDGAAAALHLLRWARVQTCPDRLALARDMRALFEQRADPFSARGVDLDGVLRGALALARRHEVAIDSGYAGLVMSVAVVTGFATALDPEVNVMDAAAPALLAYALTGRAGYGRLYS